MPGIYDDFSFFDRYMNMDRSQGLEHAGEWKQLLAILSPLQYKRVLDIGCGLGWHAAYFAEHGADHVVGIDISSNMIERAKKLHAYPQIEYRQCDLFSFFCEEPFDLVLANLSLHYIQDLDQAFHVIFQYLKEGGSFIFNIEHPTFTASDQTWIKEKDGNVVWKVDDYFREGMRKTIFLDTEVVKYHHTLTTIFKSLLQNGFSIENVEEVMPSRKLLSEEQYNFEMKRPMMLLIHAKK